MSYRHLNRIEIDLAALRHNFGALRSLLASPDVEIMPVVKSDAYGHGLIEVSRTLAAMGIWGLAVSEMEDAVDLRRAGLSCRILLLSGLYPGAEHEVFHLGVTPGVTDSAMLDALEQAAAAEDRNLDIHIKVDTGMARLGFPLHEIPDLIRGRGRWPHLRFTGLYSHLASADNPTDPMTETQLQRFRALLDDVRGLGWSPEAVHVANSAGLIFFPTAHHQIVRPGLALYGAYPGEANRARVDLRPAMRFSSRVIAVRKLTQGLPVGYGHSFTLPKDSRVAVIPVGYDDGYLRTLSNRGQVLIRGCRCSVIGRVCMKAIMADVTHLEGIGPGEEVVLLGSQGADRITAEELASWAGTINYELLCLLGTRNDRYFKGE